MNYGYVINIEDTPNDNIWTVGREIVLNDNSVVYGYEGNQVIEQPIGETFNQNDFNLWLEENRKPLENGSIIN